MTDPLFRSMMTALDAVFPNDNAPAARQTSPSEELATENRQMLEWLTELVDALDDGKIYDLVRRDRHGKLVGLLDEDVRQFLEARR